MKRLGIYVYYNKFGFFEDSSTIFISKLLECTDKVLIVINGKINSGEKEKIRNSKIEIVERKNKGYDFWGYREGILRAKNELSNYDEVILSNSSVCAVSSFLEMFDIMSKKDIDFWGATSHAGINKNVIKFNPKTKIKEHLQTYFLVFRKNTYTSLVKYFENLRPIKNKKEAIGYLEVNFTEYFKNLGYNYSSYIKNENKEPYNKIQYLPDAMLKNKCPFVKKTIFNTRYDIAQKESSGNKTKKAYNILKKTNYNVGLILKENLEQSSMSEIKTFLNFNFIIQDKFKENEFDRKYAVITNRAYLFKNVFDFNKDNVEDYDYFLFFYPNEIKNYSEQIQKDYTGHLLNCACLNETYIQNLINKFVENPEIGIIAPIPFVFPKFEISPNFVSKKEIEKFKKENNINFEINPKFLNTISGCFWIKKEILKTITTDENSPLNKGMQYSILAQKEGFLTATCADINSMNEYTNNLEYSILNKMSLFEKIKRSL